MGLWDEGYASYRGRTQGGAKLGGVKDSYLDTLNYKKLPKGPPGVNLWLYTALCEDHAMQ